MPPSSHKSGFTLVELAIVLVIIGLIIGGVLVGQDLIRAATIRSAVTDIEKYNAGVNAFRTKYNGLPGDLSSGKAVEFGLAASADANSNGSAGRRDGNGLIQGDAGSVGNLSGETALIWKDLGASALVGGTYTAIGTAVGPAATVTLANVNSYLPRSRLRDSASYYVYATGGRNYFYLAAITAAITTGAVAEAAAVTPLEAKGIDEKLDDGAPLTGVVVSYGNLTTIDANLPVSTSTCSSGTTPATYNLVPANNSNVNCELQIRASF